MLALLPDAWHGKPGTLASRDAARPGWFRLSGSGLLARGGLRCGSTRRSRSWAAARRSRLACCSTWSPRAHDAGGRPDRAHQHAAVDRGRSRGLVPSDRPRDRRCDQRAATPARWVIRHGARRSDNVDERPLGDRLWLYTNFDCNLRCDYCCVRSSPTAPRRALGLERVRRIAREAPALGVREIFVTGGEPFLLPDIGEILRALRRRRPDHRADQRHAVQRAAARDTARAAARSRDAADQPRQPDAGAARPPSRRRHLGARLARASSARAPRASACAWRRRVATDAEARRSALPRRPARAAPRTGSSAASRCAASRGRASRSRAPIWCRKSRSRPRASTGTRRRRGRRSARHPRNLSARRAFAAVRRAFEREREHATGWRRSSTARSEPRPRVRARRLTAARAKNPWRSQASRSEP